MRLDTKRLLGIGIGIAAAFIAMMALSHTAAASGPGEGGGVEGDARGIVTQAPADFRFGEWKIGDQIYHAVTGTTIFSEEFGPLGLNKCTVVRFRPEISSTARLALRIISAPPLICAGEGPGEGPGDHGLVETRGPLEAFPADLIGDWQVGGVTYTASATTTFEQQDGPFIVGRCVEVRHPLSSTVALSIRTENDRACGVGDGGHIFPVGKARGLLNDFPAGITGTWTISDTSYEVISRTILDRSHGDFFVGACVEVYYVLSDTNRTALKVSTEGLDDCTQNPEQHIVTPTLEAHGIVSSTPPTNTLFGTYVISGVAYEAISGTTRFDLGHGLIQVGDCARVKYYVQGDLNIAVRLSSGEEHECSRPDQRHALFGEIKSLPGTPNQIGEWMIGERAIDVTTATVQVGGPFTVGMIVKVEFVRAADGSLLAKSVEAKRPTHDQREDGKAFGILQSRPISPAILGTWTVASVTYEVTNTTRLTGALDVGDCVAIHYRKVADGQRVARKIEGIPALRCTGPVGEVVSKTFGFVTTMPISGFVGTWVIGGVVYEARVTSRFEQERGVLTEGAFVEARYVVEDGVNVLLSLETHVPPAAGDIDDSGTITGTPGLAPSVDTTLVLNGKSYVITDATLINDQLGALSVGAKVAINAYTDASTGQRVATQVTTLGVASVYLPMAKR